MKSFRELPVVPHVTELIETLQRAGFETYVVGGAIRDLLLGRAPKDYDVSTAATPEEVRAVFGRRQARIIGKRFQLVHLMHGGELIEVSTFRRAPHCSVNGGGGRDDRPENMIVSDNDFGTAEEDVWRRDFTVNALFFDPVKSELIDFTGMGLADIRNQVVRAIGDPRLRFEEDPVRMLRALKLVGQYDFSLDQETENALFSSLELIRHASTSRLSLELEKILASSYGDKHLRTFHDYGFLRYFLPGLDERWDSEVVRYAVDLLAVRNERVAARLYRNSVSLAMAALALPFVEEYHGKEPGALWEYGEHSFEVIPAVLKRVFQPQQMINRMVISAERMLQLQPLFYNCDAEHNVADAPGYAHGRELMMIQNECVWHRDDLEEAWTPGRSRNSRPRKRRKTSRSRHPDRRRPAAPSGE